MDMFSIVYAFMLTTGSGQFVINDATEVAPHVVEVDVETMSRRDNRRFILLIDNGRITQHVQVPLTEKECANPH